MLNVDFVAMKRILKLMLLISFMTLLVNCPVANADNDVRIDVQGIYFLNGNQIRVDTIMSNVGNRNLTVTSVDFTSMGIWYPNGKIIWSGNVSYNNMSVYIPASGWVGYTFYINKVSVPYYEGYRIWKYEYIVRWLWN